MGKPWETMPIGSMYAIYGNINHQYTPFMLAYIPAPWIRHGHAKTMGKTHPPGHRRSWSWPGSRLRPCQRPLNNTPPDVPGRPSFNEPKRAMNGSSSPKLEKHGEHGKKRVHLRKMLEFTRKHGKTVQVFIEKVGDFTWDKAPKAWEIQCIQWIARFYGDTHWYQWGYNQQIWQSTDWFKGKSCRKRCEITIKQWDSGKDFPSNNNLKLPLRSPRKHTKRYGKKHQKCRSFSKEKQWIYIYI